MSLQDFYGTYKVQTSSGTSFGLDTRVIIEEKLEAEKPDPAVKVRFIPPNAEPGESRDASYDATTDALLLKLDPPARVMFISRFVDPSPSSTYRAIYGILVMEPAPGEPRRSPVWSARLTAPGTGCDVRVENPLPAAEFSGKYQVRTTADAQFGTDSLIALGPAQDGALSLCITNALLQDIHAPSHVHYDPATVSVVGSLSSGPVTVAMSLAVEDNVRQLYGTFVVADPEQGGTYGGDDEGGAPDPVR